MDKEWVDKKNREQNKRRENLLKEARDILRDSGIFTEEEMKEMMGAVDVESWAALGMLPTYKVWWKKRKKLDEDALFEWGRKMVEVENCVNKKLKECLYYRHGFERFLDSEPMEFDGDIIITDPCYVARGDDWDRCGYGYEMEILGINHYMTRDTIYGDWSCTVYSTKKTGGKKRREKIGEFCADAGLVSVFLLSEVFEYDPGFDYHVTRPWTTTLIRDFKGTVQFVVVPCKGSDIDFDIKDFDGWDYEVQVVGKGINKRTGEALNFRSTQTGL